MILNLIQESSVFVESHTESVFVIQRKKKHLHSTEYFYFLEIVHQELKGSCEPVLPLFPL